MQNLSFLKQKYKIECNHQSTIIYELKPSLSATNFVLLCWLITSTKTVKLVSS